MSNAVRLRITEIFLSLQGESRTVGLPTVFVRLTGCPLRCRYCDTSYAFQGGNWMELDEVMTAVASHHTPHVCVTGGEPLAQRDCLRLLAALCDAGFQVSLETSGALDVSEVDARVMKVMDLKAPSSGEVEKNLYANLAHLTPNDQIKIVIGDRVDYDWAKTVMLNYGLIERCEVLLSPSFGTIAPRELAQWILDDHLPVRFQMQLHKMIWGEEQGR